MTSARGNPLALLVAQVNEALGGSLDIQDLRGLQYDLARTRRGELLDIADQLDDALGAKRVSQARVEEVLQSAQDALRSIIAETKRQPRAAASPELKRGKSPKRPRASASPSPAKSRKSARAPVYGAEADRPYSRRRGRLVGEGRSPCLGLTRAQCESDAYADMCHYLGGKVDRCQRRAGVASRPLKREEELAQYQRVLQGEQSWKQAQKALGLQGPYVEREVYQPGKQRFGGAKQIRLDNPDELAAYVARLQSPSGQPRPKYTRRPPE